MTSVRYSDPSDVGTDGRRTVLRPRLPMAVANAYRQHRALLINAGSLFATTGVTSILGAAYWIFAAKFYTQSEVGYGAAEIPAMLLLGTIGMFGLGTLLVGELPNCPNRAELVSAATIACAFGSLLLGLGFAYLAPLFDPRFATMLASPSDKALLVVGVVLTGVSLVFDMASIGVLRGSIQLWRNLIFSLVKLICLPIFAAFLHDKLGIGIVLSWVLGIAFSLILVAAKLAFSGTRLLARPDWRLLRSLARTAMAHNWLNIAITAPPAVFPVLVTLLVSPAANAAFYVAFTLSSFIYMIPTHLATVLFAMAAAEPEAIAPRVRFATKLSYAIGLPAVAVLILAGHWMLSIYGPGYAQLATVPMIVMTLGYIPSVPKALYIAICRAAGRTAFAATILTVFTIAEIAAAAAGGIIDGVLGLVTALLIVLTAQGLALTPSLIRAVGQHGSERRPIWRRRTHESMPAAAFAGRASLSDTDYFLADSNSSYLGAPNHRETAVSGWDGSFPDVNGRGSVAIRPEFKPPATVSSGPTREQQEAGIRALFDLAREDR
jgi:O-antigen/teichoic acid export membrane protein